MGFSLNVLKININQLLHCRAGAREWVTCLTGCGVTITLRISVNEIYFGDKFKLFAKCL